MTETATESTQPSSQDDKAAQAQKSILLADALLDQYTSPGSFRVHPRTGKFRLVPDESELALAELVRLYTGAWEHLDRARGLLEAAGHDVSGYESVRFCVPNIHDAYTIVSKQAIRVFFVRQKFITSRVNVEGLGWARKASAALKSLLPGVDWAVASRRANLADVDIDARTPLQKWGLLLIIGVITIVIISQL